MTEDELARCRTRLKAARPMGKQTIGARAMHAAIQTTYGLPIDDDAEHAAKLETIDAATLAGFVKKYFNFERRVQLIVGPEGACDVSAYASERRRICKAAGEDTRTP